MYILNSFFAAVQENTAYMFCFNVTLPNILPFLNGTGRFDYKRTMNYMYYKMSYFL